MLKLLDGLKDFLKKEEITIDGPVFRFHTVFTAVILIACSLVITAKQYVGEPIQCLSNTPKDNLPPKPVNTFCWIMSTYTIPEALNREVGKEVAHPGVTTYTEGSTTAKYYTYYQWVCFVLFFQGLACYFPKWLWENSEGALMKTLVMGLNKYVYEPKDRYDKKKLVVDYILDHVKMHRLYAVRYWFCEFLCLLNIFGQIYFMNRFFDGEFLKYGWDVINFSDEIQGKRDDPMIKLFPRVTKCTFEKYGPAGSIQPHDILCILPLNVINEKIYIVIWFWFLLLAGVVSLLLVYRTCLIVFPQLRPRLLSITRKVASRRDARVITQNLDITDWWVLYMLGKNIEPIVYNEIVVDLARRLEDPDAKLKR